jgi:hypothetical protein
VLRGVTELEWKQVAVLTVFLLGLGALLRFGDLRGADVPARVVHGNAPEEARHE